MVTSNNDDERPENQTTDLIFLLCSKSIGTGFGPVARKIFGKILL